MVSPFSPGSAWFALCELGTFRLASRNLHRISNYQELILRLPSATGRKPEVYIYLSVACYPHAMEEQRDTAGVDPHSLR